VFGVSCIRSASSPTRRSPAVPSIWSSNEKRCGVRPCRRAACSTWRSKRRRATRKSAIRATCCRPIVPVSLPFLPPRGGMPGNHPTTARGRTGATSFAVSVAAADMAARLTTIRLRGAAEGRLPPSRKAERSPTAFVEQLMRPEGLFARPRPMAQSPFR